MLIEKAVDDGFFLIPHPFDDFDKELFHLLQSVFQ